MVSRDHKLSMRKQCELLQLSRSRLYYQPVGESAENLRFMEIIDKQFLETVARVAPSVRARWATVWIASDGPVYEAQQSPMRPPPDPALDAAYASGSDLSGAQHK